MPKISQKVKKSIVQVANLFFSLPKNPQNSLEGEYTSNTSGPAVPYTIQKESLSECRTPHGRLKICKQWLLLLSQKCYWHLESHYITIISLIYVSFLYYHHSIAVAGMSNSSPIKIQPLSHFSKFSPFFSAAVNLKTIIFHRLFV